VQKIATDGEGEHQDNKSPPKEKLQLSSILPMPCHYVFHATYEHYQVTRIKDSSRKVKTEAHKGKTKTE